MHCSYLQHVVSEKSSPLERVPEKGVNLKTQGSHRDPGSGWAPQQRSWQLFGALAEAASVSQGASGAFFLEQSPCFRGRRAARAQTGPSLPRSRGDCTDLASSPSLEKGLWTTRGHAKDSPTEDEQGPLESQTTACSKTALLRARRQALTDERGCLFLGHPGSLLQWLGPHRPQPIHGASLESVPPGSTLPQLGRGDTAFFFF